MDLSEKACELEIEESLYVALLKTFEEHLAEDLSAMERAISASDPDALYAAAHSVKGASGSLNLWSIYDAAAEVCTFARERKIVSIGPQLSLIRREMDTLARVLKDRPGES